MANNVRNVLSGNLFCDDTFVFVSVAAAGKGTSADVIKDFKSNLTQDCIDVSQIDANGGLAGNPAFAFAGEITMVSGGFGQLGRGQIGYRYQTDANGVEHTIVEGNTNATPEADFQIDLLGRLQLTAGGHSARSRRSISQRNREKDEAAFDAGIARHMRMTSK